MIDNILGIPFVVDPLVPATRRMQVRFPRSKKKRIRKKWAKNPANWSDVPVVWMVNTSELRSVVIPFREPPSIDPKLFDYQRMLMGYFNLMTGIPATFARAHY